MWKGFWTEAQFKNKYQYWVFDGQQDKISFVFCCQDHVHGSIISLVFCCKDNVSVSREWQVYFPKISFIFLKIVFCCDITNTYAND